MTDVATIANRERERPAGKSGRSLLTDSLAAEFADDELFEHALRGEVVISLAPVGDVDDVEPSAISDRRQFHADIRVPGAADLFRWNAKRAFAVRCATYFVRKLGERSDDNDTVHRDVI